MKPLIGWFYTEVNIPEEPKPAYNESCPSRRCGLYINAEVHNDYKVEIKFVVADANFRLPWAMCEQKQKGNVIFFDSPLMLILAMVLVY